MGLRVAPRRFLRKFISATPGALVLLILSLPALADPPPVGYVGVVPRTPPIGYTGVVPREWTQTAATVPAPSAIKTIAPVEIKSSATPAKREKETLISAERLSFDQNTNIATAVGHVEIAYQRYVLHADKVTYEQNKDVMHAEGHVAMLHPDGEVSFAEQEDVTGDMKQAYAQNLGVLFPDNSRLAARTAARYGERFMVAQKADYTACNVCKENPDNPPLWQLRAEEIVHDNEAHNIYYHDATIDFAGQPVLYTPYLSTPDPTVERRQGLLSPLFGRTPEAGYFTRIPYYFDISPDKDAIFEPAFSSQGLPMLGGEYRERFAKGKLTLDGTVAYEDLLSENTGVNKGQRMRGNLAGNFIYNLDNIWRMGSDVNYVSDKSYLERYNMGSPAATQSRAYVEGFKGRDYASLNTYYFQDLQPGTQPVQPVVLPTGMFSLMGEPGQTLGGRWSLDGSVLVTSRENKNTLPLADQGPETRRMNLSAGWQRQFISDTGLVATIDGMARADGYWADHVIDPNGSGQIFNKVLIGRQFEQASITAGYPLARHGDGYQQTLEPLVMLTAAPQVKLDPRQPIEDSLDVQFDETNLFASNRFTGEDLIEGGNRATYGLRHSLVADSGAHLDVFGGQSYNFSRNSAFPELSGLRGNSSDYVGRISASPGSWLDADWGFRFSHRDLSPEAEDAHLSFGTPLFRPSLRYVLAYQTQTNGVVDTIEEGIVGFSSVFAKYWTFTAFHTQGFQPDPGPRQTGITLSYADECFVAGVTAERNEINRFDIRPGTSVLFHIMLRNLGGVHTDNFTNSHFPSEFRQTD